METRPRARLALWLSLVTVAMLGQALLPTPSDSLLWTAVLDAGHVPLFGLLAFVVLRLSSAGLPGEPRIRPYLLTGLIVIAIGTLTELLQTFVSRDADVMDLARNLLGGGAALLMAFSADHGLDASNRRKPSFRPALFLAAVALVAIALYPVVSTMASYVRRNAAFPTICNFESAWELRFVEGKNARVVVASPPNGWVKPEPGSVAHVTFSPAPYPAFVIREPRPDWVGHDRLVFEAFSENPTTVKLMMRVHDAHHDNTYTDRFNRALSVVPGANRFAIPLAEVKDAPQGRPMDMSRIRGLALFAVDPKDPISVYLDEFRLERD